MVTRRLQAQKRARVTVGSSPGLGGATGVGEGLCAAGSGGHAPGRWVGTRSGGVPHCGAVAL